MNKGFSIQVKHSEVRIDIRFDQKKTDNFHGQNPEFEIVIDGILLNLKKLKNQYGISDTFTLFLKLYSKFGIRFLNELEGEFCGCIYDKKLGKLSPFMNFTATKKLFYWHNSNYFFADTELISLKKRLEKDGIHLKLDKTSAYSILVCTNMLENNSPLEGVKRLMDREYIDLDISTNQLELKEYFSNESIPKFQGSKSQALDQIHEIFQEGIQLEYEKDFELKGKHFALLSGGLDSRVALLYAHKLGFKIDQTLCFSMPGYLDEVIAREIAQTFNFPFLFVPLDTGEYLKNIDEITKISEGLVRYSGAIHTEYAYRKINTSKMGLIHSGQLGDGVLGGFNKMPFKRPPTSEKIAYKEFFWDKFSPIFQEIANKYNSEELFYLRNIGYNRAVIGSFMAEKYSYQTSPFMYSPFLKLALSLPEEWKFNQKIYLEWINKHCKEATQFIWERTLLKPNKNWKTKIGDKMMTPAYRYYYRKINRNIGKIGMTQYGYYYQNDASVKYFIDTYFQTNLSKIDDKELREDLHYMYSTGNFNKKILALTVLGTQKYLFG